MGKVQKRGVAMQAEYAVLLSMVRSQMNGTPFVLPEDVDMDQLVRFATAHSLEPFVYAALEDKALPEELADRLFGAYHNAIFRDTQFDFVRQQVSQVLSKEGIEHVFMRGICLKEDYPMPSLRTMSDVDVLVRAEDLPKIRHAMASTNAAACYGDGNHRNFIFPQNIEVEFHPMLLHCSAPVGTAINPGWQYVPKGQPGFCHVMTEEGFYLNVMSHFASHFFTNGAGIRFVLDIWVCRNRRKVAIDRAFVEQELQRLGLLDFAQKVEKLGQVWFSGEPMQPELEEIEAYICSSSLHGLKDRGHLNALCFAPGGNSFSALWGKAFYPKGDLENRFDWLQGRPWLKPVAWMVRAWIALTRRLPAIRQWHAGTKQYSKAQIQQQQEKLARFGVNVKENR